MEKRKNKGRVRNVAAEEAIAWFVSIQARPLTDKAQVRFKQWLSRSAIHRAEYDNVDLLWYGAPKFEDVEVHRSAPDRRPFSLSYSEAWLSAVFPMAQRTAHALETASIFNKYAVAVPSLLL